MDNAIPFASQYCPYAMCNHSSLVVNVADEGIDTVKQGFMQDFCVRGKVF